MRAVTILALPVLSTCIVVLPCPPESRRRASPRVLSVISSELASGKALSAEFIRVALELQSVLGNNSFDEDKELLAHRRAAAILRNHSTRYFGDDTIYSLAAIFFYEDHPADYQDMWNVTAFKEFLPALASRHPDWALRYATWMPPVVSSRFELDQLRSESKRLLEDALSVGMLDRRPGAWQSNHWDSLSFPYAYHGVNNVHHLQLIASAARQLLPPWFRLIAPHVRSTRQKLAILGKRWRVGFSYRASKTKPLEFAHVLGFDEVKFEVILFCWEGLPSIRQPREVQQQVLQRVDRFIDLHSVMSWEQKTNLFLKEKLDVLIFFEIGMDPQQYLLAFSRLALIQVALHGHAQTTGLKSIDLFVSFRPCETHEAQQYYSERLILLDDWFYIEKNAGLPPKTVSRRRHTDSYTARLGIPLHISTKRRYVVCKTVWKLSLDFDEVIASILELDHDGIVLVQPMESRYLGAWVDRLAKRLHAKNRDRVVLLPCSLPVEAYTSLVAEATIVVDTTPWGGWQTALEAFALGVPVVTLEHSFLCVGRSNAAFYRTMMENLSEASKQRLLARLIAPAGDLEGLARRAVGLAQDKVAHASVSLLVKSLASRLWERKAGNDQLGKAIEEELVYMQSKRLDPFFSEHDFE